MRATDIMIFPLMPIDRVAGLTSLVAAFALGLPVCANATQA